MDVDDAQRQRLLAALRTQELQLIAVQRRLDGARDVLLRPLPEAWRGPARHACGLAMSAASLQADALVEAVRSARRRTAEAADWLARV